MNVGWRNVHRQNDGQRHVGRWNVAWQNVGRRNFYWRNIGRWTLVDETSVAKTMVNDMLVDETLFDKMSVDERNFYWRNIGQWTLVDETSVAKTSASTKHPSTKLKSRNRVCLILYHFVFRINFWNAKREFFNFFNFPPRLILIWRTWIRWITLTRKQHTKLYLNSILICHFRCY